MIETLFLDCLWTFLLMGIPEFNLFYVLMVFISFLVRLGLTCLLPEVENGVYTTGATFINYEGTATTTCNLGYSARGGDRMVLCQANRTTTPVIVCEGN